MDNTTLRIIVAAALLLSSNAVPARASQDRAGDGEWTPPAASPAPGGTPETDYGSPDRRRMDEERRKDVLDQLCRKLKLKENFDVGGGDWPKTTLGFSRRMESDLDGSLALVDEEELKLDWGRSVGTPVAGDSLRGTLWVGSGLSGRSLVVRRLGTFKTCSEVDRLLKLTDIKTFLPVRARRIRDMAPGELWKIPMTIHLGYGLTFSDVADGGVLTVSIGAAKSKSGTASMTLLRLSEKKARFRFRIDFVQVHSRSLSVNRTFTPIEFATEGAGFLEKLVKGSTNRELRRYLSASLGWGRAKSDGKRAVIEFSFDPTDPEAAEAMAEALRGNLRRLFKLAARLSTSKTSREETIDAYKDLARRNMGLLGKPDYAALSEYGGRSRSFALRLPLLARVGWSSSVGHDTVTRYTGEGGTFLFQSASRAPSEEYFDVPFFGPLIKDLESRSIETFIYQPEGAPAEDPIAVYIQNRGMLRLPRSTVIDTVEEANAILRLAGTARGLSRPGMELPVPPPAPASEFTPSGPDGGPVPSEPADQKGWMSFTLVMNRRAVRDALSAGVDEVLKAFARSVPAGDRDMASWLVRNGRLGKNGLVYDSNRAAEELGLDEGEGNWLAKISGEAAGLARDFTEAAAETDPALRSEKFANMFSYRNRSGLKHPDVLRVLVQFMDPMDLTGDFISAVEGLGGAPGANEHLVLKKGRSEVPLLGEAAATRARFSDGSILTD